ncbi:uncharacterized protein LOC34620203 [Cyclospora cayetanensis]|uniref:Uncharacterized protein LOC34620203 n=1 Tax=Cyclospora cayetanensis TaxID=88456 RepID=A0A6P6RYP1_9EIME|nr:uncharacterized protein LOC34620203 [Cyclospora cayetanensis]
MRLGGPALLAAVIPSSGRGNTGGLLSGSNDHGASASGDDGIPGNASCAALADATCSPAQAACSGAPGMGDLLLLLLAGYRAVICHYSEEIGGLRTLSMHSFAELGPRAAAVNALLVGPPHIKLADEGPLTEVDDGTWGPQGSLSIPAGQLPVTTLRAITRAHVFDLESFDARGPFEGPCGALGEPKAKGFLALFSVDLLHVVCLHLSLRTEGPSSASAVAPTPPPAVAAAQGDATIDGTPLSPPMGPHPSTLGANRYLEKAPSHVQTSPGGGFLCPPFAAAGQGKSSVAGGPSSCSPWPPEAMGASPVLEKGTPPPTAGAPGMLGMGHLSTLPPVAFLAAAVQRQQQQHQQAAEAIGNLESLGEGTSGNVVADGEPQESSSLWGYHNVLGTGLSVASCFFLSLATDVPLPPATAAAVAAAAAPGAAFVDADTAAATAAAAATSAAATAGAAGLPYLLLDMVPVASLLSPSAALLMAEGPRELGLMPFAGSPGAGEVFALLLAIHPEERDIQIIAKIPSLLGDTFALLSAPSHPDGLICLSPDSVSFLSFSGGGCGGGTQRLGDAQQQQQQPDSLSGRTVGLTHIVHPAGLVRKDLLHLPSVVFDCSSLRLRLEGAAAAFLSGSCLFLLSADGRPALAHLVITAGKGITDFLWTSVELLFPAGGGSLDCHLPQASECLSGQLLLPRSDSLAVWNLGSPTNKAVQPVSVDSNNRYLLALGGRIREGTGICLVVAEPQQVVAPRRPWGGPPGASRDLQWGPSSIFSDESAAQGLASLETCCSFVPELQRRKGPQAEQQQQPQQQQEMYTTDGKQLIEIFPDGSVEVAQQRAPILRHAELQEEDGPLPQSSPLGYLHWLRTQQAAAASAAAADTAGAAASSQDAASLKNTADIPSSIAAAVAALNSSSSEQDVAYPVIDHLGLIVGAPEGPPLLPTFRFVVADRLPPQGIPAPRCVTFLPLPPWELPTAVSVGHQEEEQPQQLQQQQQALEAFCSSAGNSRFLTAGGLWPHGALGALQRAVPCRPLIVAPTDEGNPRILWALQQQNHQEHGLLLLSSDPRMGVGETRVFSLRDGYLMDLTARAAAASAEASSTLDTVGAALSLDVPTLFAASLLGGLAMVQLTAEELRVLGASGKTLLCPPIDMNELPAAPSPPLQQQPEATGPNADAADEGGCLADSKFPADASAAMDVDTEEKLLRGRAQQTEDRKGSCEEPHEAREEAMTAPSSGEAAWNARGGALPGAFAAAVRGSAAGNWVCVVLDDFRLRLWQIDDAAVAAAAGPRKGVPSEQHGQVQQQQLLHEVSPSAMPCCMRGRVKSAQLYVHPRAPTGGEDETGTGSLQPSEALCCLVTLEGPMKIQALHVVSLQRMECLFSTVDLRLVSPLLRNCGSCAQRMLHHQVQQQMMQSEVLLVSGVSAATAAASCEDVLGDPAQSARSCDDLLRSGEITEASNAGPPHPVKAAAAAAAALAEEGIRDARRSVTCLGATPLPLIRPAHDGPAAATAAVLDGTVSEEAEAAGVMAAPEELQEEVLNAELVLLEPEGDTGPTLVVFLTGRPPLIYRAFEAACTGGALCLDDGQKTPGPLFPRKRRCQSPQASPLFPWSFRLEPHSCTDCIASIQRAGAAEGDHAAVVEPSVYFAVASGYTTASQQVQQWGGGVALLVPPLSLPDSQSSTQQQPTQLPVLWLCSSRNRLFVHPSERRDTFGAAAFTWPRGPPGSFAFLYGVGPSVCLSEIAAPFDKTSYFSNLRRSAAAAAAAADELPKTTGPFRLDGPLPFWSFSLGASTTHVAVSTGTSYILPPQYMPDAAAPAAAAGGRLVGVALHHPTEESEQIRQVLESRNALQKAQLALQGRAGAAAAAGAAGGDNAYEEGAPLPGFSAAGGAEGEGGVHPNPYLSACADGRVEVEGEAGRQYEIVLFHQDNLQCPLGSFLLNPCEEVMSLQFVLLDALEFLAVGVGQPLSEGVETMGRLLLLRLPQLLAYGRAATAAATAANEMPEEMDGDLLARGAFADVGMAVTAVSTLKHFVITGDLYRGVSLLAWRFDSASDSRRLELVSRTVPHWMLPVAACDAVTEGGTLGILAADPWGNVRLFSLNGTQQSSPPILQQLQVLRCDSESMEVDAPVVAFKQLLTETGDVASAAWSAEGGLLSFRLVDEPTADLLRELQGWLETCLPSECGLFPTASRMPAGPPSIHLRLWVAEQQRQLQKQLLQQYRAQDEDAAAAASAVAADAAIEATDAGMLLQQMEYKALDAMRSRLPVYAPVLRLLPLLSLPVQQQLLAAAPSGLLHLLQRHFGSSSTGTPQRSPFSWVRPLCTHEYCPWALPGSILASPTSHLRVESLC